MSDLTRFQGHCQRMASAEHKLNCPSLTARESYWPPGGWALADDDMSMTWLGPEPPWVPPHCDGCMSDTDRALFAQLADEIDAYLNGQDTDAADQLGFNIEGHVYA